MRRIEQYEFFFEGKKSKRKKKVKMAWAYVYDWADSVVVALVTICVLFTFFFRIVGVSGISMYPTLNDADWLAVTNIGLEVERGEIVVITQPNALHEPLIKRIIAVGGETVDIDFERGRVNVDGVELREPYVAHLTKNKYDVEFPLTVPEGHIFVLGDNRNLSLDSRSSEIGLIDERFILGKAAIRIYPFRDFIIE